MKILIACEFSGVVRDAFCRRGHDVWSCDLLPTESPGNHIQGDAIEVLYGKQWDLAICHPPCTYLSNSGVRWLYKDGGNDLNRWKLMNEAVEFFRLCLNAPIERICVENPIQHKHCELPKQTQVIQPWMFGHGETKATCLWLKGLPKLTPMNIVSERTAKCHREPPGPDRWKRRSRTLTGIADAMASQWG